MLWPLAARMCIPIDPRALKSVHTGPFVLSSLFFSSQNTHSLNRSGAGHEETMRFTVQFLDYTTVLPIDKQLSFAKGKSQGEPE